MPVVHHLPSMRSGAVALFVAGGDLDFEPGAFDLVLVEGMRPPDASPCAKTIDGRKSETPIVKKLMSGSLRWLVILKRTIKQSVVVVNKAE